MKCRVLIICLLALNSRLIAQAAEEPRISSPEPRTLANFVMLDPQSKPPQQVIRRIPRNLVSCLWTRDNTLPGKNAVWFHLFAQAYTTRKPKSSRREKHAVAGDFRLDIFQGTPGHLCFVRRVPLQYQTDIKVPLFFTPHLYWLDGSSKKRPMLRLQIGNDVNAQSREDEAFITFPDGYTAPPTVQTSQHWNTWDGPAHEVYQDKAGHLYLYSDFNQQMSLDPDFPPVVHIWDETTKSFVPDAGMKKLLALGDWHEYVLVTRPSR